MKNFKKISIALTCALCVILIACSASLVMLLVNGARPGLLDSNGNFTTEASGARLGKTYDYGEAYVDGIIFVGDSTISSISGTSLLRDKNQVWSCADGTLPLDYNASTTAVVYSEDGKSATVSAAAQLQKPQYMIITIGIENGVAHCSEEKFKEYYSKLVSSVKAASPETKIILQSIFPTSKQVSKETPNISNEKISPSYQNIPTLTCVMSILGRDFLGSLTGGNLEKKSITSSRVNPRFTTNSST